MADVFISYKREERDKARVIAEAIAADGYSVWWDVELLSGEAFGAELEAIIQKAKASIVLWSTLSIQSHWVKEEAELARTLGTLVPVLLDEADPPFGFRGINAENLRSWDGSLKAPEMTRLLRAVRQKAGPAPDQSPRSASEVETAVNAFHYEATYWASISQSSVQRISEYEAYLERFGADAQFADLARSRISTLRQPVREPVFATLMKWGGGALGSAAAIATIWVAIHSIGNGSGQEPIERSAWGRAQSAGTLAAYQTYLRDYPSGANASAARTQIAALTSPPEPDYRPGQVFRDALQGGGEGPEMVVIPAGSFLMGSPAGEVGTYSNEGPQRTVRIGYQFAVGKYEVTWPEWEACVADGGCNNAPVLEAGGDNGWGKGSRPVINVSWEDAQAYVEWLSRKTGERYRLLSESEWEYAARAVTTPDAPSTRFSWGDGDPTCSRGAWNGANFSSCTSDRTEPVGYSAANAFGVHDLHGNVSEWVEDCYEDSYSGAPSDGSARTVSNCSRRVFRGGSWVSFPRNLRSAFRIWYGPTSRSSSWGFRVARTL